MKVEIKIPTLKCRKCGWKWMPRIEDVQQCPHCKSATWFKPRKPRKPKKTTKKGS